MWKVLSTAVFGAVLAGSVLTSAAEARPQGRAFVSHKVVVFKSPGFVKGPVFVKKHFVHKRVLLVGAAPLYGYSSYNSCGYSYRMWQTTGLGYWKARYFSCAGHY